MKKNIWFLLVAVFIFVAGALMGSLAFPSLFSKNIAEGDKYILDENIMEEFEITDVVSRITGTIFAEGCIKNENDAAEIAKVILKSAYGENFDHGLPLDVNFDDIKQEWLINNQLPDGVEGGQLYIIMKKSNAEVIAIWGTR